MVPFKYVLAIAGHLHRLQNKQAQKSLPHRLLITHTELQ
jgi:hypothetical protein